VIGEAIDTALTLGWALYGWIITLAAIASILTLAAIATGAWGAQALWRAATGPSWARGGFRARIYAARRVRAPQRRTRPRTPHKPPHYEEAA
jgi:hypothetical protein